MTSVKYIGMDVHTESISIAVRNSLGKIVMESVIETEASTLRGDLRVVFEKGTWATWLTLQHVAFSPGQILRIPSIHQIHF